MHMVNETEKQCCRSKKQAHSMMVGFVAVRAYQIHCADAPRCSDCFNPYTRNCIGFFVVGISIVLYPRRWSRPLPPSPFPSSGFSRSTVLERTAMLPATWLFFRPCLNPSPVSSRYGPVLIRPHTVFLYGFVLYWAFSPLLTPRL